MYLQFFGFSSAPFSDTPDVRQFWEAHASHDIFKAVLQGLVDNHRLQTITAEPGLGKSMLCRRLLYSLRSHKTRFDVHFMPFPNLKLGYLLETLLSSGTENQRQVLLIDEAQSLTSSSLLELAGLLNDSSHSLQAVLFAQPELDTRLQSDALKPLSDLVTHRYSLTALNADETASYIEMRMLTAGGTTRFVMDPKLISVVYKTTGGIPRLINILMRKALLHAYQENCLRLTLQHIQQAAATTAAVTPITKR